MRSLTSIALLVAAGAAGCFDGRVGSEPVGCTDAAGCPAGFRCSAVVGACVAAIDDVVPRVRVADMSSATRAGAVARVGLEADVALAAPPTLTLATLAGPRALDLSEASADARTFTYETTIAESDGEGSRLLVATFASASGPDVLSAPVGELLTDFTPPALVPGSVTVTLQEPPSGTAEVVRVGAVRKLSATRAASLSFAIDDAAAAVAVSAPDLAVGEVVGGTGARNVMTRPPTITSAGSVSVVGADKGSPRTSTRSARWPTCTRPKPPPPRTSAGSDVIATMSRAGVSPASSSAASSRA